MNIFLQKCCAHVQLEKIKQNMFFNKTNFKLEDGVYETSTGGSQHSVVKSV